MQNNVISIRITSLYWSQPSSVVFAGKRATFGSELKLSMVTQTSPRVFCKQNNVICIRITSLYGSQNSPMVSCFQNSDFSTRISNLYGSQPSSVVLCIHNSDIMTTINRLYGSQSSPVVLCMQNNVISIRNTSLYGSQTPFLDFQNFKSLWVPDLNYGFCIQKSDFSTRIASSHGSQPSSVV